MEHLVKEGKIDVGVTGDVEARLAAIDPELNLGNLHANPDRANDIRDLLRESINSFTLNTLQENAGQLGINQEYTEMIIDSIINHILNPEEKGSHYDFK